jgi:hypothetical protein
MPTALSFEHDGLPQDVLKIRPRQFFQGQQMIHDYNLN